MKLKSFLDKFGIDSEEFTVNAFIRSLQNTVVDESTTGDTDRVNQFLDSPVEEPTSTIIEEL